MTEAANSAAFVGDRLREAREVLGLSIKDVAELIEVSRVSVSNYERGRTAPRDDVVAKLSRVLGQPFEFFFNDEMSRDFEPSRTHFRTTRLSATDLKKAEVRMGWLTEYFDLLSRHLDLPPLNLPDRSSTIVEGRHEPGEIERAAAELRAVWGVREGPLPDLVYLAEVHGVVVARIELELPKLDGFSFFSVEAGRPFVILNASKASYVRSRFDLAHELGHMVLHRSLLSQRHGEADHKRLESEAHRFASALLLPADRWLRDVRGRVTLGSLKALKPKWRTSIGAMIIRARDLDVISVDESQSLWKQYSTRHWRAKEPYDDYWEPERPRMLREATEILCEPPLGLHFVREAFCRSRATLAEFTGLPESSFGIPGIVDKSIMRGEQPRSVN